MGRKEDKYLLTCPSCGKSFFPWEAFMITSDKTSWKPHVYCPSCGIFNDLPFFGKDGIIYNQDR